MHFCAGVFVSNLDADLALAGWDGALEPYPGISTKQFAYQHLRRSVLKKHIAGSQATTPEGDAAALKKFLAANAHCETWVPGFQQLNEAETEIIGEVKSFIYDFFNPRGLPLLSLGRIAEGFNCGPGASIDAKGQDFYTKFSTSRFTATSEALLQYYQCSVGKHRIWGAQEVKRHELRGFRTVSGNRLGFAAKYATISRVICTEPSLNMFFQKGIERLMVARLREIFGIDLRNQQAINRRLARLGARTGRVATIDLESASDTVSRELCKFLLEPSVFRWFDLVRSPETILPDGTAVKLHMMSSMGNATTFPLQTLIFTAVVLAVYKVMDLRIKKRDRKPYRFCRNSYIVRDFRQSLPSFAVNGDDIICWTESYDLVCKILSWMGFRVNEQKSFSNGPFRESCGADYFGSTNVRGVYVKRTHDVCDIASAINRLNVWSAVHCTPLVRSVGYLYSLGGARRMKRVPLDEADTSGLKVPSDFGPVRRDRMGCIHYSYWRIKERRVQLTNRKGELKPQAELRTRLPTYFLNEEGLYNALLAGGIRSSCILQRPKRRQLEVSRSKSPCWDFDPDVASVRRRRFERWKSFTALNLGLHEE